MKKTLLIIAGVLGLLALLGWRKAKNLQTHFEKLSILPVGISDIKVSLTEISFKIDVKITNPDPESFDVSGVVATLKRLNVFWKGKYLATGQLNLTSVSIPANDELVIHDVAIVLPTTSLLQYIATIDTMNINDISVEAVIQAFGSEYYIKQ